MYFVLSFSYASAVLPSTGSGTARRTSSGTAEREIAQGPQGGRLLRDRRWGTVAEPAVAEPVEVSKQGSAPATLGARLLSASKIWRVLSGP